MFFAEFGTDRLSCVPVHRKYVLRMLRYWLDPMLTVPLMVARLQPVSALAISLLGCHADRNVDGV